MWQYAQLMVTCGGCPSAGTGEWTILWHARGLTAESSVNDYAGVVGSLNSAGERGWELVDVAALDGSGPGHVCVTGDWSLTRYTFRRWSASADGGPVLIAEQTRVLGLTAPTSDTTRTAGRGPSQSGTADGSPPVAPAVLVSFGLYWERDGAAPDATGRFLIRRRTGPVPDQARLSEIASLGGEDESPDAAEERREEINAALADYAASWAEALWGDTWWQTPQDLTLSQAAALFDGSAEWLHGLIEDPVADVLSAAGADGPMVDIGGGVAANFVTARVTAPLETAARLCELAGIVIGLLTGMHALVMACGKRLAHDEVHKLIGKGAERVLGSFERGLHASPGRETGKPGSSRQEEASAIRDTSEPILLTRPGGHRIRIRSREAPGMPQGAAGYQSGGNRLGGSGTGTSGGPRVRAQGRPRDRDEYEGGEAGLGPAMLGMSDDEPLRGTAPGRPRDRDDYQVGSGHVEGPGDGRTSDAGRFLDPPWWQPGQVPGRPGRG